ncbi:MAG: hypothetical protein R3Y47_09315 [Lachnospiraceae bacterium]
MKKKLLIANELPILGSIWLYLFANNSQLPFWVMYDAVIVPIYLLGLNISLFRSDIEFKHFFIPYAMSCIGVIIHMAYFDFNLEPISRIIWSVILLSSSLIIVVGGLITLVVARKIRNHQMWIMRNEC